MTIINDKKMKTFILDKTMAFKSLVSKLFIVALIIISVIKSKDITEAAVTGMHLCGTVILPSVFAFLILSDFLVCSDIKYPRRIAKLFETVFHINHQGLSAFILGTICGFPTGAKIAAKLYDNNVISKEECQRLIGFSSNPSLSFVIAGVGVGLIRNLKLGILLYISVIASAIIVGIIFRKKDRPNSSKLDFISKQKFDFVESIKNAGITCVGIASYIIFFSIVLCIIKVLLSSDNFLVLISPIFEVGNAVSTIGTSFISLPFKLALLGFALGFSGLSANLQVMSFLPSDISKNQYLIFKLCQGAICSIITMVTGFLI